VHVAPLDAVALGVVSLAAVRGLLIGLIREAFSIGSLGGAVIAVRMGTDPLALWLRNDAQIDAGDFTLRVAAACLIVIGVVGMVTITGRFLRRGVRAAGLGWADRLGGGLLGSAEGALAVSLLLAGTVALVGRDHPLLATSRTLAALDEARQVAIAQSRPLEEKDVSAPPPERER